MSITPIAITPVTTHSLADLLRSRAAETPHKIAYTYLEDDQSQGRNVSYLELDGQARTIAARLRQICLPGDRVLLVYDAGLEFVAGFFGCMYADVIAIPVPVPDYRRNAPVFLGIAHDAQPKMVLTTDAIFQNTLSGLADELPKPVELLATDSISGAIVDAEDWEACRGGSVAYLQYTSGSTSKPRGVMVTHSSVLNNLRAIDADFKHDSHSVSLTWLPHFHDMGLVYGILQPMFNCFPCLVLSPAGFSHDPGMWLRLISRYRVTHSGGPNFAYDLCVRKIDARERSQIDLSCWQVAFNGAEPIQAETLIRFADAFAPSGFRRESFYMAYGLAEATLKVSGRFYDSPDVLDVVQTDELGRRRAVRTDVTQQRVTTVVSCGLAALETEVQIVEPDSGKLCEEDGVGEVWVRGPGVTAGYWRSPEHTTEIFNAQTAATETGYLRTGDLGYLSKGQLFLTGRLKDLIVVHGRNYYAHDIEATVAKAFGGAGKGLCVAFSIPQNLRESVVLVQEFSHRIENFEPLADTILSAVAVNHGLSVDTLAFVRFGKIPRTTSGKVRRNALRAQFMEEKLDIAWKRSIQDGSPSGLLIAPRTSTEILLHEIWSVILGPKSFGVQDRFLDLGGDSVMAAQIVARASTVFSVDLPVTVVFEQDSIAAMASHIEQLQAAQKLSHEEDQYTSLLARIDELSGDELDFHLNRLLAKNVAEG